MKDLPIIDYYNECNNKKRLFLFLTILDAFAIVLTIVLFSIFINYNNQNYYLYLGGILIAALSFVLVLLLVCFLLPYSNRCKHILNVYHGNRNLIKGTIVSINNNICVDRYATGLEIVINDKNENYVVYWEDDFLSCPLKMNENVQIIESSSFIISYEVLNDEDR